MRAPVWWAAAHSPTTGSGPHDLFRRTAWQVTLLPLHLAYDGFLCKLKHSGGRRDGEELQDKTLARGTNHKTPTGVAGRATRFTPPARRPHSRGGSSALYLFSPCFQKQDPHPSIGLSRSGDSLESALPLPHPGDRGEIYRVPSLPYLRLRQRSTLDRHCRGRGWGCEQMDGERLPAGQAVDVAGHPAGAEVAVGPDCR
jgi:hypothetical protein